MSLHHHHNRHNDPINPARGLINGLAISVGSMIIAGMMWAALAHADGVYAAVDRVNAETQLGASYRTVSMEQVR